MSDCGIVLGVGFRFKAQELVDLLGGSTVDSSYNKARFNSDTGERQEDYTMTVRETVIPLGGVQLRLVPAIDALRDILKCDVFYSGNLRSYHPGYGPCHYGEADFTFLIRRAANQPESASISGYGDSSLDVDQPHQIALADSESWSVECDELAQKMMAIGIDMSSRVPAVHCVVYERY